LPTKNPFPELVEGNIPQKSPVPCTRSVASSGLSKGTYQKRVILSLTQNLKKAPFPEPVEGNTPKKAFVSKNSKIAQFNPQKFQK
jgi:hypothetical protein